MNKIASNSRVDRKPVGQGAARNAVLINVFVTPGMGSLMAGRILEGLGQIVVALIGFTLVILWFVNVMVQYYGMINGQETAFQSRAWLGIAGAITFIIAWLWALATSISLIREVRRNELEKLHQDRQPAGDAGSK